MTKDIYIYKLRNKVSLYADIYKYIVVFCIFSGEAIAEDYVLRRMITTDERGGATVASNPARLDRKDNLFR